MSKKCLPGVICIENITLIFISILLLFTIYFFYYVHNKQQQPIIINQQNSVTCVTDSMTGTHSAFAPVLNV